MADLLISDIDPDVRKLLERRAEAAGRSLQLEVKSILEGAARGVGPGLLAEDRSAREEADRQQADRIWASFGDRICSDSAEIIRQMRDG